MRTLSFHPISPRSGRRLRLGMLLPWLLCAFPAAEAGVLTSTDFNAAAPWPAMKSYTTGGPVSVKIGIEPSGTIDTPAVTPGKAVQLTADASAAKGTWGAGLTTGRIAVGNRETHLGKLTLGFDLWTSRVKAVKVRVQSFTSNSDAALGGTLEALVMPPVAGAYYRHALDLSKMTPTGAGKFNPLHPFIQFQFEINGSDTPDPWPAQAGAVIRIDNVSYVSPAYYVNGKIGNDKFAGTTEAAPFATIQRAIDAAVAGDVILVAEGTYGPRNYYTNAEISKAGTPSRWIVLRAHPDGKPAQLVAGKSSWSNIRVNPDAAYVEIRGLSLKGYRSAVKLADAEADYAKKTASPTFNGNGIDITGRAGSGARRPHHLRLIDNEVFDHCGGGISAIEADYVTIEGNVIHGNCWYMQYAGSGISFLTCRPLDKSTVHKNFAIGNIVYRNQCFVKWKHIEDYSDGNGIIVDSTLNFDYPGRTLVQNNLVFGNGGSGIHAYKSAHVDIVNNTAYRNSQCPHLTYAQIFAHNSDDVTLSNNISWAQKNEPFNTGRSTNTKFTHNLYWGEGNNKLQKGTEDLLADPAFVKLPTLPEQTPTPPTAAVGTFDFRLKPGSPALDSGSLNAPAAPRKDLVGTFRPYYGGIERGAYETYVPPANKAPQVAFLKPTPQALAVAGSVFSVEISATDADGKIVKVELTLDGKPAGTVTAEPYKFTLQNVAAGDHALIAKAFDDKGATGTATVSFSAGELTGLRLVDAATDRPLGPLTNGQTIDLAVTGRELNIVADVAGKVGSVKFTLDAGPSTNDNAAPYAAGPHVGSDFKALPLAVGAHVLKAAPFTLADGGGTAGKTLTVEFTIIDTPPPDVTRLVLVVAGQDVGPLTDGAELDLFALSGDWLVRAETTAGAKSVRLTAPGTPVAIDDTLPFTTAGFRPAVGKHTISATAFTEAGAAGRSGKSLAVSIVVTDKRPEIAGVVLVNADSDHDVGPLRDGATLDLATVGERLSIRADAVRTESVRFEMDGVPGRVENLVPYALLGDGNGDYNPWTATPGSYVLKLTPYAQDFAGGKAGAVTTVRFTVVDTRPTVTALVLIDAATDRDLGPLTDGAVLDLGKIGDRLSVRAEAIRSSSVKFELSGLPTQIENYLPFALRGDAQGDYHAWNAVPGSYVLTVTPFAESRATGKAGKPVVVNFTVVRPGAQASITFKKAN